MTRKEAFMTNPIWLLFVFAAIILWSATSLLYKAGARGEKEEHICLKFSVCVGMIFFVIALAYLIIREEPYSIWESAARHWPMTVFGAVYAVVNTISYKGYVYNEATVESPVEGISGGTSVVLLIIAYLLLGRVDSVSELLTPLRTAGIIVILASIILLSVFRNRENRKNGENKKAWMKWGLGTLIFPVVFAVIDGLETIVTGICLDTSYGFSMPEGDSIIIVGIVCYSYAMAMNSVSTDPLLAVYPIMVMLGGRIFLKEKVSHAQYVFLLGIVAGSVMVIADTVL